MKRTLGLRLAQLLGLGRIEEIQLLDFAIGGVRAVELLREQRAVGRGVLASGTPVLPHGRKAVGRDRIRRLDHGELGHPRIAESLSLQIGGGAAVQGTVAVFQAVDDVPGEFVLSAMFMPAVSPNIFATLAFSRL